MVVAPPPADSVAPALVLQDLQLGRGMLAQPGDTVAVHYVVRRLDGTLHDSSRSRRFPLEFSLGMGAVIRGLDEGVKGMRAGGLRRVTVPADYAYSEHGRRPAMAASATLVYDVELLSVR